MSSKAYSLEPRASSLQPPASRGVFNFLLPLPNVASSGTREAKNNPKRPSEARPSCSPRYCRPSHNATVATFLPPLSSAVIGEPPPQTRIDSCTPRCLVPQRLSEASQRLDREHSILLSPFQRRGLPSPGEAPPIIIDNSLGSISASFSFVLAFHSNRSPSARPRLLRDCCWG